MPASIIHQIFQASDMRQVQEEDNQHDSTYLPHLSQERRLYKTWSDDGLLREVPLRQFATAVCSF